MTFPAVRPVAPGARGQAESHGAERIGADRDKMRREMRPDVSGGSAGQTAGRSATAVAQQKALGECRAACRVVPAVSPEKRGRVSGNEHWAGVPTFPLPGASPAAL